ncbi:MAG: hypothetical protein RBG13Loki_4364 [Promethearchaeota archaeon CR_4]|nr:MAG: hypothetical protein RBG13Loki_4364 [Candidatus Lokiarchaeota archaeon CR_4]
MNPVCFLICNKNVTRGIDPDTPGHIKISCRSGAYSDSIDKFPTKCEILYTAIFSICHIDALIYNNPIRVLKLAIYASLRTPAEQTLPCLTEDLDLRGIF